MKNNIQFNKTNIRLPALSETKVGYFFNQKTGLYQYMSEGIIALTGYSLKEINEKGFKAIVKDVLISRNERYEVEQKKKEKLIMEEFYAVYRIKTKDKKEKLIEDNAFTYIGEEGTRVYSTGVLRDITEFQNYVDMLQADKRRLEAILKLAEIIFMIVDSEGKIEIINEKGCNVFGCTADKIIGQKWTKLTARLKEESVEVFKNLFDPEKDFSENSEITLVKPNEEERVLSLYKTILKDQSGKTLSIVASGEDITERKKSDNIRRIVLQILQAANTERNLDDLFKFIHKSVAELMPAENFYIALYDKENEIITFPYFVDQYDKDAPPMKLGKGLTEYVLRKGEPALINKKMDDELIKKGESELIGTQSPIWLGVPLKIRDNTIGVIVVQDYEEESTFNERHKDILEVISYSISMAIERKRVEQEREELISKLSQLNASKDKLFSLISHDLRSPFNSLLGFSEILTTEYNSLTDEEIKEYLKVIYEASKNLFGMTNNLLQYSRFQTGRIEFRPEKLSIEKIVNSCLKLLSGNAVKKQINLITKISPDSYLIGDEDMMYSVVQNLISNAIKFTEKGGDVIVTCRKISSEDKSSDELEFVVEDTGIGISKQDLNKIMVGEMFSNPGTEREYGTGLGLLLTREFIEKNGGVLSIESEKYKGSKFISYFPAAD